MKFCGILRRLGIACHAVGLLMFLLGFMTVNWVDMPYRRGSAGLWQICYNRNRSSPRDANDTGNHTSMFVDKPRAPFQLGSRPRATASSYSTVFPPKDATQRGFIDRVPTSTRSYPPNEEIVDHLISLNRSLKPGRSREGSLREDGVHPTTGAALALLSPIGGEKTADSSEVKSIPGEDSDLIIESDPREGEMRGENGDSIDDNDDNGADGGSNEGITEEPLYDDSLPAHIKLDSDGCWKYGVTEVDAYLHMVRALMAISAFCYAYGIANGSTRRARIQPRSSFTRQHRGELLSYTGAFLSYFAVQIYEFGFHADTLVLQFVSRPEDLKLGWSAQSVRFSSLMVAPSVLLLLAPTLRIKLRKLLSDCWAAIGCTSDEGEAYGERRAGLFASLTHNFWQDPLGNCFRFITCRRAVLDGEPATPDSEMGPVDRNGHPRMSGLSGRNFHPSDSSLLHAPPPPYSFLHPIGADEAVSSYNHGLRGPGTDIGRDEQYFVVSGILSVAIPHRPVGGAEPAPAYQDISPPPTYEEAMQGIVRGVVNASQPLPVTAGPAPQTETLSFLENPSSTAVPNTPPSPSATAPVVMMLPTSSVCTSAMNSTLETMAGTHPTSQTGSSLTSGLAPTVPVLSPPISLAPASSTRSPSPTSTSLLIQSSSASSTPQSASPSSSRLHTVSLNQGATSDSAAAVAAAAVVSAAVTSSARESFTLPALRQFPQPLDRITRRDAESTGSNHKTLAEK